jgi:hypothetical protein
MTTTYKKSEFFFKKRLDRKTKLPIFAFTKTKEIKYAKVAQLVERNLAKVEVASSNLVFRSRKSLAARDFTFKRRTICFK